MKNVLFCVLLGLSGLSCARAPQEGHPRVALVLKTLNNPFFIDMQRGAQEAARTLGLELLVQAAEREVDVEKQMQIIENLIQAQVDVLCITPSGSREIVPAIAKANQAGIPVIILDTRVDPQAAREANIRIHSFVGSDNYQGGVLAGRFLAQLLNGKGEVAVLEGIPGHETGDSRLRGFHDALRAFPELKVVASQPANWERDQGFNVFQNILQAHPQLKGLFACNDMMALGAIEAISLAGKTGQVQVVGFDAVEDARQAIREGRMQGSVAQYPGEMGRLAVESAARLLAGETVPQEQPVPIELITLENLETAP